MNQQKQKKRMHEDDLIRISLICAVIGMMGLAALVLFIKPVFVGDTAVPKDETITFSGIASDIYYASENSSILQVERCRMESVYIDAAVDESLLYYTVNVTGRQEGDFFFATSVVAR